MKMSRLPLYLLFLILFVLAGCAPISETTELGIPAATLDKIKSDCITADPTLVDLNNPISKNDIIVERVLTGNFHNEGDCLVVLTIPGKTTEDFPHVAGYAHYYFVILDSSRKTVKGNVFAFVADSISYSASRSYGSPKDYLFLSGVVYGAGCQEFAGGLYDPVDWAALWSPTNTSGWSANKEQWPILIGGRIYVLEIEGEIDLPNVPHINSEFKLQTDFEAE